jgi:DNA-binding transcriptional ArsR family regulator
MKKQRKKFSYEALELIAARFRVLSEPMRLKVLMALGEDELSVSELVLATGSGQANISKHLGLMFKEGLLVRHKEGLNTFYAVADKSIFDLCDTVCASLGAHLSSKQRAVSGFAAK